MPIKDRGCGCLVCLFKTINQVISRPSSLQSAIFLGSELGTVKVCD